MSDLLAPILFVMQNEVDAFWCFVGYMDRVSGNFDFEAGGIKHQVLLQFGHGSFVIDFTQRGVMVFRYNRA